jgi:hypothetical protein
MTMASHGIRTDGTSLTRDMRRACELIQMQTFMGTVSFDQYCEESNVAARPASFSV